MSATGRLAERTVVVTGAGSGIGRAASLLFAAEGAALACLDRDDTSARSVADEIETAGGRAIGLPADVTDEHQLEAAVEKTIAQFGTVDGLYANAGIDGSGGALETTRERWDHVLAVDLTGVWLSMRAVLPTMIEQGRGSIVAQSSISALVGTPRNAPYSAAKGGVISLVRQVAIDYAAQGIRANALCPGTVWTPLVADAYSHRGELQRLGGEEATTAAIAARLPMNRLGTPDEVASFVLYLLSDESRWVSGGVHVIDGAHSVAAYSASATSLSRAD